MPFLFQATSDLTREPYWYEIIAGVLSIPVIALSIAYSYLLIKKVRAEETKLKFQAKKFELEIQEKERVLPPDSSQGVQVMQTFVEPLAESRNLQFIILRFILLFLVLRAWALVSFITDGIDDIFGSLAGLFTSNYVAYPLMGIGGIISALPTLGAIVTNLFIGIPLFRDVNKLVGSKRIDTWFEKRIEEWNKHQKDLEEKKQKTDHPSQPHVK